MRELLDFSVLAILYILIFYKKWKTKDLSKQFTLVSRKENTRYLQ